MSRLVYQKKDTKVGVIWWHERYNIWSKTEDGHKIYVIMKTMCPPGCHNNGFVATHALGHEYILYMHTVICIYNYVTICNVQFQVC